MGLKFSNNAATTLQNGISNTDTTITVVDGSVFPALGEGDHCYLTLISNGGVLEFVKVNAISGNSLTCLRGQDDTTASAFNTGDSVELRVTAAVLAEIEAGGGAETVFYDHNVMPGRFFIPHNIANYMASGGTGGGEYFASNARIILCPIVFINAVTISKAFAKINTASVGGNFRLGLYSVNAMGEPDALLFDSGPISTDSQGMVGATLSSPVIVPAGRYYMADAVDNTTAKAQGVDSGSSAYDLFFAGIKNNNEPSKLGINQPFGPFPASASAYVDARQRPSFGSYYQ